MFSPLGRLTTIMIRGMYFFTEKCKKCGKVICGENEGSRKKARKDWWKKLQAHHKNGCIPEPASEN